MHINKNTALANPANITNNWFSSKVYHIIIFLLIYIIVNIIKILLLIYCYKCFHTEAKTVGTFTSFMPF